MRQRTLAIWLFWGFSLVWFIANVTVLVVQARQFGHGLGIGDGIQNRGGRLDGITSAKEHTSFIGDTWRLALTAAVDLALIGFWFLIARGIGAVAENVGSQEIGVEGAAIPDRYDRPIIRFFVRASVIGTILLCLSGFAVPYVAIRYGWGA